MLYKKMLIVLVTTMTTAFCCLQTTAETVGEPEVKSYVNSWGTGDAVGLSHGETNVQSDKGKGGAKQLCGNAILGTILTPAGKMGVLLMDKIATFQNCSYRAIADKVGADPDGTLYLVLFIAGWTGVLILAWFGVKRVHRPAYGLLQRWRWIRFLAIASGFCSITFYLVNPERHHPDDYWQAALIPVCGLLLSLIVAFFYACIASWKSISHVLKVLFLVLIDFIFGFTLAGLIKVIFSAILISFILVIGMAFAGLGGATSTARPASHRREEPSRERRAPAAPPAPPPSQPPKQKSHTYHAEWSGKRVEIYDETKQSIRVIRARDTVVGVQVSGSNFDNGMVAIAMTNGKTDLYHLNGQIIRRG